LEKTENTGKKTADTVIVLKDVSFSYDSSHDFSHDFSHGQTHWILKDISLDVSKGEWIGVLGHNGSGKSTLVKILGALQTPSQGVCRLYGYDSGDGESLADIHRKVGLVFQDPESQIVGAVVEDDVAFAPENQGLPPTEIERKIAWALGKVGLSHKRGALSSALSGGEKQRLALAGALAADAECLVLDEPTSMLDPEGRVQVENLLRDLHGAGATIVQVTHRIEDVAGADRVLVLSRGQWAWQGRREDFWDQGERLGFRLPPLLELQRRLISKGIAVPSRAVADFVQIFLTQALLAQVPLSQVSFSQAPLSQAPLSAGTPDLSGDGENKGTGQKDEMPNGIFFEIRSLGYGVKMSTAPEIQILKDISCRIPKGKWFSILGRTGSGKSTLIQHLNGLCEVQSGEIWMEGKALPREKGELRDLRRRVGLVFQSPEDQLFSPTVREELAFAPLNWGFTPEETEASVKRAIKNVGLGEEYLERNPLLLSGGERRLVAIASTLAADPECVVLDEPTAGLDACHRGKITALLSRLKEAGKTIVTVTHDFEMAFEYSDRLLVMDEGAKICEGSVKDVLPVLAETADISTLPEILQLTALLRRHNVHVPLTWDFEFFVSFFALLRR
jgi:energy-coupling factor transport system ATP-binding protein